MTEGSEPEFGSMASWTLEAVEALGPDHAVPAACRGSGGPGALDWFADALDLGPGVALLDIGAGVGGPAEHARRTWGVRPVLVEPMPAACRAAAGLFGLPTTVATAEHLPIATASVDRSWSLGVLCTTSDQRAAVRELARALAPGGRGGLLVYCRRVARLSSEPDVNHFPSDDELGALLDAADLVVRRSVALEDVPSAPADWDAAADAVDRWIEDAHGDSEAWREADRDESTVADLLDSGQVAGALLTVEARAPR